MIFFHAVCMLCPEQFDADFGKIMSDNGRGIRTKGLWTENDVFF